MDSRTVACTPLCAAGILLWALGQACAAHAQPRSGFSMIDSARRADAGWWLAGQDPLIGIAALSPANPANRTFRIVPAPARNPGVTRRRAAHGPQARADWFYAQRAYPLAEPPVGALQRARTQAEKIAEWSGRDKTSGSTPWTLVGPAGFDSRVEPSWGRMSGRVRALAIDPNNSNRLLAGTATGGAWLSSDAGDRKSVV